MSEETRDVLEGLEGFTPGPWKRKATEGDYAANVIHAQVNIGGDEGGALLQPIYQVPIRPSLAVGHDGKVYARLTYDDYRQFPSRDFRAMQLANARLIARAPELVEEIRRLRKAIRVLPCYLNPYGQTYECAVNKPCKACAARALLPTGDSDDQ